MATFDPDKRAMIYDALSDATVEWTGALGSAFRKTACLYEGEIEWNGRTLTGWCLPEEWEREWRRTVVSDPLDPRAAPFARVTPLGTGYIVTEFGPYTQWEQANLESETCRLLPGLKDGTWKLSALDHHRVLYWQFDRVLDPLSEQLKFESYLEEQIERRERSRQLKLGIAV